MGRCQRAKNTARSDPLSWQPLGSLEAAASQALAWSDSEFFNGEGLFLIVVFLVGAGLPGNSSAQLAVGAGGTCGAFCVGANPARLVLLEHLSCASHAFQQLLVSVALGKLHQGEGAASGELGTHLPAFWRGLYLIKTNEQMTAACVGRGTALHDYTL